MVRVTKPNGYVVFDVVTEECLDVQMLAAWAASEVVNGSSYPATMPRKTAIDYFEHRGFDLKGTFLAPMGPGRTEVFVFRKQGEATV
jgi:hypothetical protein